MDDAHRAIPADHGGLAPPEQTVSLADRALPRPSQPLLSPSKPLSGLGSPFPRSASPCFVRQALSPLRKALPRLNKALLTFISRLMSLTLTDGLITHEHRQSSSSMSHTEVAWRTRLLPRTLSPRP